MSILVLIVPSVSCETALTSHSGVGVGVGGLVVWCAPAPHSQQELGWDLVTERGLSVTCFSPTGNRFLAWFCSGFFEPWHQPVFPPILCRTTAIRDVSSTGGAVQHTTEVNSSSKVRDRTCYLQAFALLQIFVRLFISHCVLLCCTLLPVFRF